MGAGLTSIASTTHIFARRFELAQDHAESRHLLKYGSNARAIHVETNNRLIYKIFSAGQNIQRGEKIPTAECLIDHFYYWK
jgi:hypothetical protein